MLLETCPTPEAAGQMARYLLDALAEPIELEGRRIAVTASAGIALVSRREQPPAEEILRNADIALYRAKDEGAGRYRLYEERMHAALLRRMELEAELRRAIAAGQFLLHYQPIVEADGRAGRRRRGAGPLGAPRARHGPAGPVHRRRRAGRADRAARAAGSCARPSARPPSGTAPASAAASCGSR